MQSALAYSDIYLRPNYSDLDSRRFANTTAKLGKGEFKIPVMPANMVSCIDVPAAGMLSQNGYFYVMHRFLPGGSLALLEFCRKAERENWLTISISVGVQLDDYELINFLPATRCDYITIDIAHGHSKHVKRMLGHIRQKYKESGKPCPFIIVGNVATGQAVKELAAWGADAVKVGIGGGGACSTKNKTGFHIPMFSCVKECAEAALEVKDYNFAQTEQVWEALEEHATQEEIDDMIPDDIAKPRRPVIIADGGVRENADIAKALVAGADWVMAGSLFAACKDSPAENVYKKREHYNFETGPKTYLGPITHKKYFGSASARNKGHNRNIEGLEIEIECNGMTYFDKLLEIQEDLQSAISYAGGRDLTAFGKVEVCTTKAIGTIVNNNTSSYTLRG